MKQLLFSLVAMWCFTINAIASAYKEVPIDRLIDSSDLIIKGKVEGKSSQSEDVVIEVQVKKGDEITTHKVDSRIPMTTYTIVVSEVINGKHSAEKIIIKMEGGCGDDGMCLNDSTSYNYVVEDDVVMFLRFNHDNKNYYSTDGSLTAFKISKSNDIYREGEFAYIESNSPIIRKETDGVVLSLDELKIKVKEAQEDE
ncbi:hypothetical protein MNBD_GAMMA03-625 [hydrothermal vent metagenome]|uniref:Uncharacterized protein n=1 Tax=hydrothermal vent metagenome TaxID=652676 RepID=A0A3B0W6N4_9ZZZZ